MEEEKEEEWVGGRKGDSNIEGRRGRPNAAMTLGRDS